MKHTFKSLAVLFAALFFFSNSKAQVQKIAYVNFSNIIDSMRDTKIASKRIDSLSTSYQKLYNELLTEFKRKQEELSALDPTTSTVILEMKQNELYTLKEKIDKFERDAQADIEQKQRDYLEPIVKKAKDAVSAVAKEGGYAYVLDAGSNGGMVVLYHHDGDDLTAAVKKRLGM